MKTEAPIAALFLFWVADATPLHLHHRSALSTMMCSTTMTRNFPSPLCTGGMCTSFRPRHPNSTTRGLLVPPLSPLYCMGHQKVNTSDTMLQRNKIASSPSETKTEETKNVGLISLEIDTSVADLTVSSDEEHTNLASCMHKTAMTPRSSMRRTQRNIPSPSPTLATVSCGSSCNSSIASSNNPHEAIQRRVTFGTVEIREHPRILGDNPSVKRGPALSLGWYDNGKELSYDMDTFEAMRANERRTNIALSSTVRKKLLLRHNVSHSAMRQSKLEIAKIKRSRRHHNVCVEYDDTMVVMEQCLDTVQGILTGKLADWELAKLMKQAELAEQAAAAR